MKQRSYFTRSESVMEQLVHDRCDLGIMEFLEIVGIPHKTWRRWITGKTVAKPTIPQVKALVRELKLESVEELPDDFSEKFPTSND